MRGLLVAFLVGATASSFAQNHRWVAEKPSYKSHAPYAAIKAKFEGLSLDELGSRISQARKALAEPEIKPDQKRIKSFEVVCGEVVRLGQKPEFWGWMQKDEKAIRGFFLEASKTNSLEATYLSFLLGCYYDMTAPSFVPVGEQLVKAYPRDLFLMYTLVPCYQPQAKLSDEPKARALVDQMKRVDSASVRTLRAEGVFYYLLQMRTKSAEHRRIARERFTECLRFYPAGSPNHDLLKSQIAELS